MRELPINSKNIFVFLLVIAISFGFTALLIHFSATIKDEPAEETVELKYSKKGLYLYPRFEMLVSNSELPVPVSKKQYESIQVGDQISGYMKSANDFVTEKNIRFEQTLGIAILIVLYLVVLLAGSGLLKSTKFVKSKQTRKDFIQKMQKTIAYTMVSLYIIVGMIFLALTATNVFHKINKWNQTEVTATVLGGDFNTTRTHRGSSYKTYELFLHYQDQDGEDHITKKAVTGNTYNQYDVEEDIPLTYRNNHVYDTFISTKNVNEIWPAFFNLYTFVLGCYLISLIGGFRAWRKKKREREETAADSTEAF